uniref:Uncharacterized protein n=1 Tax=Anguilla anguilla TaxID=7936 RepID=A0A0E9S4B3_ANGAN
MTRSDHSVQQCLPFSLTKLYLGL